MHHVTPTPSRRHLRPLRLVAALLPALALMACSSDTSSQETQPAPVTTDGLRTMSVADEERTYWVDVPEGYDGKGDALPLVLALHGTGGSHERWLDDTYNLKSAVGEDAVLVYPDALVSSAGTRQWVTDRDVPFIDALLDRLPDEVTFDPDRILVTGQSSGAGMSHEIGCRLGDRVRAVAPQAGVLMSTECTGSVAVIQVQGTGDPVVPIGLATSTNTFWAKYNGLDAGVSEPGLDEHCVSRTAEADHPYPVLWCTHNEGTGVGRDGHKWPSFAGKAIWEAFAALPDASPTSAAPTGGGNANAAVDSDTTATFTLRFPEDWPSTPVQGAVVAYAPGEVTPTTAPLAFMTMSFAPGDAVPGGEVTYEVPVSWTQFGAGGVQFPGTYTLMVTMHTENGGYPIPVPEMDLWVTTEYELTGRDEPIAIDGVLDLTPISGDTGL